MVPDTVTRSQVPAVLLVLLGLGIALYAGVQVVDLSRDQYTYSVSTFDGEYDTVYTYSTLSAEGKTVVEPVLNASEPNVTVPGDPTPAPEFYDESRTYYILFADTYYCLDYEPSQPGYVSITAEQRCHQGTGEDSAPVVYRFSTLSSDGQAVFLTALNASGNERTRYGPSPPEFESGGDTPSLNAGEYLIRYEGTYYQLSVTTPGPLYTGLALGYFTLVGSVGLALAAVGSLCSLSGRTKLPIALLAGVVVVAGPVLLENLGALPSRFVATNTVLILFGGFVMPVILWISLSRVDAV